MLRVTRSRRVTPPPSRLVCEAAALLGVQAPFAKPAGDAQTSAPQSNKLDLNITPGKATVILGPSGAGKTHLLADIAQAAQSTGHQVLATDTPSKRPASRRTPTIDVLARSIRRTGERTGNPAETARRAMSALARAGLAELRAASIPPESLSQGERERLSLAHTFAQLEHHRTDAAPSPLLILDEFAAALDNAGAVGLACLLTREAARLGIHVVLATHRPTLLPHLHIAQTITLDHAGHIRALPKTHGAPVPTLANIHITPGTTADLARLAHLHYHPGKPATIDHVLIARDNSTPESTGEPTLAGVLAVSMPSLNAAWRAQVWPDIHRHTNTTDGARRLNDHLRCISRVIIDPRYRARGIATQLVRHYLDDPTTPRTEAIAAMGTLCPFFERAGMTPQHVHTPEHHRRLLDAIEQAAIDPGHDESAAWRLTTPNTTYTRLFESDDNPQRRAFFIAELKRWARTQGGRHKHKDTSPRAIFDRAALALLRRPTVYTHEQPRSARTQPNTP